MEWLCRLDTLIHILEYIVEEMYTEARRVCAAYGCIGDAERVYAEAVAAVRGLRAAVVKLGECNGSGGCDAWRAATEAISEARRAIASITAAASRMRIVLARVAGGAVDHGIVDADVFREYALVASHLLPLIEAGIVKVAASIAGAGGRGR